MAFDGITTYHLIQELKSTVQEGHIRKVYQPENDEIRLTINHGRDNDDLLLSANANNPRVYLTDKRKPNPNTPPSFCMVLRKHILNGTIVDIRQHESDRVLIFDISSKNEFNEPVIKSLIVEVMGRNSNIILVRPADTPGDGPVIIDSLKKVGSASNRYRQILPGLSYITPPESGRLNFFTLDDDQIFNQWKAAQGNQTFSRALVQNFLGVSPGLAREICYRAGVDSEATFEDYTKKQLDYLYRSLTEVRDEIIAGASPRIYYFNHRIQDFSTLSLHHLGELTAEKCDSVSSMLESFYYLKDKKIRFSAKSANLKHQLTQLYKKDAKKLQNLNHDLQKSEKDEKSKYYGDLITANIYQIKKGMKSVTVPDYTDPDMKPVTIPLKVNESPSQNAQRYYKKYNKAKRAQIQLAEQIGMTSEQVYYLESLLNALDQSTELTELDEIRHEVAHSDLTKKKAGGKDKRPVSSKPLHYRSSEGFEIFVGKNNYQNDEISTRLGVDEDCWLHVKDIPGSHVLVVAGGRFITEATLLEAGALAAWFSKARGSENVPVDYVEYKYVKKPKKAKPGMVIFTNQNTMYVTPRREVIDGLTVIED